MRTQAGKKTWIVNKYFHPQDTPGCSLNIYTGEILFSASSLSSPGHGVVDMVVRCLPMKSR